MAGRDCGASHRSSSAISFSVYIPNPYVGRINVANEKTIDPQIECLYWTSTDWSIHNIYVSTDVRNFVISTSLLRFILFVNGFHMIYFSLNVVLRSFLLVYL